jgi:hypothetical protein
MVILPIASILAIPLLLDLVFIVMIVKALTRKKRKEFPKMGEIIGAIIIWGIFMYLIARG